MPKPFYEYHQLTYRNSCKMEPPLGEGWEVYKSRIRVQSLTVMVIWRRLVEEPVAEPTRVASVARSKDLPCIAGITQCLGPYENLETSTKCAACVEYERIYTDGKADLLEMLETCESFIRGKKSGLLMETGNADFIKAMRLHVDLHGVPSVDDGQRSHMETLFHSLFV
jgi:hypothetical protein